MTIICPNSYKTHLINKRNPNDSIKYISKSELIEGLTFSYDVKALEYLKNKYNSYENSKEILDNLMYVYLNKGNSNKINELRELRDELREHNLIKENNYYKYLFINKSIKVIGYSEKDLELKAFLGLISNDIEYVNTNRNQYNHILYKFKNISDEVLYQFNKIIELLNKGIDAGKIHILSYSSDYNYIIKKYLKMYNIHFNNEVNILSSIPLYHKFINHYKNNNTSLINSYNDFSKMYTSNKYSAVMKALKELVIKVKDIITNNQEEKELIISLFDYYSKKMVIRNHLYKEEIDITDELGYIEDDEYLFVFGFSNDFYPTVYRDTSYLNDIERKELNINTSLDLTNLSKEYITRIIKETKNVSVSYKLVLNKNKYYKGDFINLTEEEGKISNERYSNKLTKVELGIYKENKKIYGINSPFKSSKISDSEIGYNSYDHSFKKFKLDILKTNISPTSITTYGECPFKYYISNVLKFSIFEDSFYNIFGTTFHYLLESSIKTKTPVTAEDAVDAVDRFFNIDTYRKNEMEKQLARDKFLAKNLILQAILVSNKNLEFMNNTPFKSALTETTELYEIDDNFTLKGKIDKYLIDEKNKRIIVIDYKTGDHKFILDRTNHGLELQLPIYSVLLSENYPEYKISGVYIQNVYEEDSFDNCLEKIIEGKAIYRMRGFSATDLEGLVGANYKAYFNDIKTDDYPIDKNDPHAIFNFIKNVALREISKFMNNIKEGNFAIAPIMFKSSQSIDGCKYCKYRSICYRDNLDIRHVL